jgi:hypothetical protein
MNMMEMLKQIADRTPQPEPVTLYTVTPFPMCKKCRNFDVANDGDICEQCTREQAQGYEVMAMLGRLADGFQSDHGTRYHAVKFGSQRAMCGAQPGKRSVGWSEYHGKDVTCPRCIKKVQR